MGFLNDDRLSPCGRRGASEALKKWCADSLRGGRRLGRDDGRETDQCAHAKPVRGSSAGADGCTGGPRGVQAARREYSLITPPSRWRRTIGPLATESTGEIGMSRPSPRWGRALL